MTKFYNVTGIIISLLLLNLVMSIFFGMIISNIIKAKHIIIKFEINDVIKEAVKKVALPAFLATFFVVPLLWVTNFIFTNENGYEEFAAFSVCLQWFTILNYLPQQLGQVKPIYTQLFDLGEIDKLKNTMKHMMIFSIGFSVVISALLMIVSPVILKMYGEFYKSYTLSFVIMLVSSIFYSIQSQYSSILQAIGKIWMCLGLNIIWAICFIISFIILYGYGTFGYTLTYLISYLIYSIISVIGFNAVIKKSIK